MQVITGSFFLDLLQNYLKLNFVATASCHRSYSFARNVSTFPHHFVFVLMVRHLRLTDAGTLELAVFVVVEIVLYGAEK